MRELLWPTPGGASLNHRLGLAMAAVGAVAFSGKAIVAKLMYRLGADAFSTVGLRMLLALPLFIGLAWWASRSQMSEDAPLSPSDRWRVVGLGFSGYYLASTLDFMGLQYISASLERAILYLNPTLVLLLSAWVLKRRITALEWGSVALAYLGVGIVFLHDLDWAHLGASGPDRGATTLLGAALVFGSALSYAVYLMGSSELVQRWGSLRLVSYASCVACVLCIVQWGIVWWFSEGSLGALTGLPWQAYGLSAANAVLCTVLPIWLVMQGVARLGAALASQVGMVGPLSTIWMAAWWLHEPVTWRLVGGTAAILAGIVLLSRARQQAR